MSELVELVLGLFWAGYLLMHAWLLRKADREEQELTNPLQGETECITPAMK